MTKIFYAVLAGFLIVVGGVYFLGVQNTETSLNESKTTGETPLFEDGVVDIEKDGDQAAQEQKTEAATSEKTIAITETSYSISPAEVRVKKGTKVTFNIKNTNGFHNFIIDEYAVVSKNLQAGGSTSVTFIADKSGSFEYYCSIGSHRQLGMKGTLIVE